MMDITYSIRWLRALCNGQLRPIPNSKDELGKLIEEISNHPKNIISKDIVPMTQGILSLSETTASEIMIPQARMRVVDREDKIEDTLKMMSDSGHSRFPVVQGSKDKVVGIVLAKELLGAFASAENSSGHFVWNNFIRTPIVVPESKPIDVLLSDFKKGRNHMIIVVNEYGGVAGLLTIEDVLEQIVGDITDESDSFSFEEIIQIDKRHYIIHPHTQLAEINKRFNFNLVSTSQDTIAGYIFEHLGRMAKTKDLIEGEGYRFEIVKASKREIERVRLRILNDA